MWCLLLNLETVKICINPHIDMRYIPFVFDGPHKEH
jgi:hypothetical protein